MSTTASLNVSGPQANIRAVEKLSQQQLKDPLRPSFHEQYRSSCYIFVGGLDPGLSEGDIIVVFSQWGEIFDINLVRDSKTGKSKGFAFLGFEDQRSSDLAVDNANGMRLIGRSLRVDHVYDYLLPREGATEDCVDQYGNPVLTETGKRKKNFIPTGPWGRGQSAPKEFIEMYSRDEFFTDEEMKRESLQ